MTQRQQNQIEQRFIRGVKLELAKMYMPMDEEMEMWHKVAMKALDRASPTSLSWPQEDWDLLRSRSKDSISLIVVGTLCTAIEDCNRLELEMTELQYSNALKHNAKVIKDWRKLVTPVEEAVGKRYELMNSIPSFSKMGKA